MPEKETVASDIFDLTLSPIPIAAPFHDVEYASDRYPGADGLSGFENGANCQHYAYEFIRSFGYFVPDFRSSTLWEDKDYTTQVTELQPFDLVIVHKNADSYGAHVDIYLGQNLILHLSKKNHRPAIETLQSLMENPDYKYFIGAKRCRFLRQQS